MQKYRINRSWGREWNFLVSIMKHRTYAKQGNNILISTDYSAVWYRGLGWKLFGEVYLSPCSSSQFLLREYTAKLKDKQTTRLRH